MILSYVNTALQFLDPANELRFDLPEKSKKAVAANNFARTQIPLSRDNFFSRIFFISPLYMEDYQYKLNRRPLRLIKGPVKQKGTAIAPTPKGLATIFYDVAVYEQNQVAQVEGTVLCFSKEQAILTDPFIYYAQHPSKANNTIYCLDSFFPNTPIPAMMQVMQLLSMIVTVDYLQTRFEEIPKATKENLHSIPIGNSTNFTIYEAVFK